MTMRCPKQDLEAAVLQQNCSWVIACTSRGGWGGFGCNPQQVDGVV